MLEESGLQRRRVDISLVFNIVERFVVRDLSVSPSVDETSYSEGEDDDLELSVR